MTVHLVELDPEKDSQQYKRVQDRFQQTCSGNQIVKIERVQNPALFGSYMIRKQKMDETKGSNEQWLFHGTPGNNCKLINHTGFNRSFHGKNGEYLFSILKTKRKERIGTKSPIMSPNSQNSIRSRKFPYVTRQYATMCNCIIMLLIKKPRFHNLASIIIFPMSKYLYEKEATVKHQNYSNIFVFVFVFHV